MLDIEKSYFKVRIILAKYVCKKLFHILAPSTSIIAPFLVFSIEKINRSQPNKPTLRVCPFRISPLLTIITYTTANFRRYCMTREQSTECEELLQEMDVVSGLIQKCINENAVKAIDQDEYISRYNSLVERHEKAQNRYDTLQKKRERRLIQAEVMSGFLFAITELDTLQLQFSPPLWHTTVDHVTVYADERLVFHFKNSSEVEVQI